MARCCLARRSHKRRPSSVNRKRRVLASKRRGAPGLTVSPTEFERPPQGGFFVFHVIAISVVGPIADLAGLDPDVSNDLKRTISRSLRATDFRAAFHVCSSCLVILVKWSSAILVTEISGTQMGYAIARYPGVILRYQFLRSIDPPRTSSGFRPRRRPRWSANFGYGPARTTSPLLN